MNEHSQKREHQWHPNRTYLQLTNDIVIDSCFPCGNIANASIISPSPLTIEVEGNTDVSFDTSSKYWLYFRIRGFKREKPIRFILKNANHLRKYLNQSRYRPYMMFKQEDEPWQAGPNPIDLSIVQNGQLQGSFTYQSDKFSKLSRNNRSTNELYLQKQNKIDPSTTAKEDKKRGDCYFAVYQPYSCEDLTRFIDDIKKKLINGQGNSKDHVYFNEETIAYSYERRKISLITITSTTNIESYSEKEPIIHEEIFPNHKQRPYKYPSVRYRLKNNPVIIVTARVHPSQTYSSFFVEGLIEFLLSDCKASLLLRELFIFQIIPMLNPDGVEHGNFRFDHQMRNLNRYYGQSSIDKTPSIRAAQLLISYFKNRNNQQCQFTEFYQETYSRLFMYIDVHGHSSAMPSFIYGNHPEKIEHSIQNKMFCKLIESNCGMNSFSRFESQFSKKNMTIQQKYDEFSKLCAGRAFAGRGDTPDLNLFHSYTFEVLPYWEELPRKKTDKNQKITTAEYSKVLARQTMMSLLDLLDLNPESKYTEGQLQKMRRHITKQCYNQQARKAFLFRRAESTGERSSYSEISKMRQGNPEQNYNHLNEYVLRWFNNQIFLKHLAEKAQNLKESKFLKFHQKILKVMHPMVTDCAQSPQKKQSKAKGCDSPLRSHERIRLYQTSGKQQDQEKSSRAIRSSKCFISREQKRAMTNEERFCLISKHKEKIRFEGKINKQTIELREEFYQLIPKQKLVEKQTGVRFPKREYAAKRDAHRKDAVDSPEKNEKQPISRIQIQSCQQKGHNAIFEIKVKQIKPKPKTNIRINTQGCHSQQKTPCQVIDSTNSKLKGCNSQVGTFVMSNKVSNKQSQIQKNSYHRPSFIEQFIIKIREEREGLNSNSTNKFMTRDQIRSKAMKFRPNIKDQIDQQDKKILPVLRRNKIFTIASEPCQKEAQDWKTYETIMQNRKRTATIQSETHIEQLVSKTKKILSNCKEEYYYRQNVIKKSHNYANQADFS